MKICYIKFLYRKSVICLSGFKLEICLFLRFQYSHPSSSFITPHTMHPVLGSQSSCHFCLASVSLLSTEGTSDLFLSLSQDR